MATIAKMAEEKQVRSMKEGIQPLNVMRKEMLQR